MGKGPLRAVLAVVAAAVSYFFVTSFRDYLPPDLDLMSLIGIGIVLFFALFAAMFFLTKGSD